MPPRQIEEEEVIGPIPGSILDAREVAIDFETFYASDYSVQDLGYSAYVADPRFDALLVAVSDGVNSYACHPRRFPWAALNGKTLIAHNAAFDQAVFRRLQETRFIPKDVQPAGWHDTAALCAYIGAPRPRRGRAGPAGHETRQDRPRAPQSRPRPFRSRGRVRRHRRQGRRAPLVLVRPVLARP
jgi:hypothetical protein